MNTNPGVPKDANIIHVSKRMSGEISFTYYTHNKYLWRLCDWVDSQPEKVSPHLLWMEEGLTYRMLGIAEEKS